MFVMYKGIPPNTIVILVSHAITDEPTGVYSFNKRQPIKHSILLLSSDIYLISHDRPTFKNN